MDVSASAKQKRGRGCRRAWVENARRVAAHVHTIVHGKALAVAIAFPPVLRQTLTARANNMATSQCARVPRNGRAHPRRRTPRQAGPLSCDGCHNPREAGTNNLNTAAATGIRDEGGETHNSSSSNDNNIKINNKFSCRNNNVGRSPKRPRKRRIRCGEAVSLKAQGRCNAMGAKKERSALGCVQSIRITSRG